MKTLTNSKTSEKIIDSETCEVCGKPIVHRHSACTLRCLTIGDIRKDVTGVMASVGIPRRYHRWILSDYGSDIKTKVEASRPRNGYFIKGKTGVGKSCLAAAIVRFALEEKEKFICSKGIVQVMWKFVPDLLGELKASFGVTGTDPEAKIIHMYARFYGLLVLDDFGSEKVSDWSIAAIYNIVAKRYEDELPTMITSNLMLKDIHEMEPRLASRLKTFCNIVPGKKDRRV